MKKILCFVSIVLLSINVYAYEVNKSESKNLIAIIDMNYILKESKASLSIQNQIEQKRLEYQSEFSKKDSEIRKKDQELAKERNNLNDDVFEKRMKSLNSEINDFQKWVQDRRVNIDKSYNKAMNQLQERIYSIINDLALEKGFDIVIPLNNVLYAKDNLNITSDLLKKLDVQLSYIQLEFEEIK